MKILDKLIRSQSTIITLDVDDLLFQKLHQIAQAGLSIVEINSSDRAILTKALRDFPTLRIGAGSITTTQQLEDCYQAGVQFITSPGFLPPIAQTAAVYAINYYPGVTTLSEAMSALDLGCLNVRPYPATIDFCMNLNKYLPSLSLYPAEIEWEKAERFLNIPSVAAVSVLNPKIEHMQAIEV